MVGICYSVLSAKLVDLSSFAIHSTCGLVKDEKLTLLTILLAGLLSREAAQYTESFVMMVGLGDDVVMRLGVLSTEDFRDKLVQVIHATRLPKVSLCAKGKSVSVTQKAPNLIVPDLICFG